MISITTVKDVIEAPLLKGLKVISGSKGLNRMVGFVTVMEVPDVIKWLKGEDFVITSFYAIKDDVDAQCQVIRKLAKNGCAALALKMGQYIKKLDERVVELSEKLDFPILQVPYSLPYIDIINQVMALIFREKDLKIVMETYLREIIFSVDSDEVKLEQKGLLLGLEVDKSYFCALTFNYKTLRKRENSQVQILDELAKLPIIYGSDNSEVVIIERIAYENTLSIFLNATNKKRLEEYIEFLISLYSLPLEALKGEVKLSIGESKKGVTGIKKSYYNSVSALKSGQMFFNKKNIYRYNDLEIYTELEGILGKKTNHFLEKLVTKIENKDILETLIVYFDYSGDLNAVADSLFVHRNTVTYRMKRIHKITGLNIKNADDNFKLYLLSLYYKANYTSNMRNH